MSDVTDAVDSLSRNITSLLRYVFPPIVGFLIVFVGYHCPFDEVKGYVPVTGSQVVLVLLVMIALGLTVFHIHWSFLHVFFALIIVAIVRHICLKDFLKAFPEDFPKNFPKQSMRAFHFARWIRRIPVEADGKRKEAHEIQKFLDLTSNGTHFLYCSVYSALVWFCVFYCGLGKGGLTNPTFFWVATGMLILIAIFGEFWTTHNDLIAYRKYNCDSDVSN